MKTELKAKFLQHLNRKKQDQGFTLIELLVVIIIIGILSAIALPSFLNQANKAKQSEAKQYVGSMNRAQQAYVLEKGCFVDNNVTNFSNLGLGISTETVNYTYKIQGGGGCNPAGAATKITPVTNQAQTRKPVLRAYLGGVDVGQVQGTGEATSLVVLCEAKKPPQTGGPSGTEAVTFVPNKQPECPTAKYDELGS